MLDGELTTLRARLEEDVALLHADLYEDVAMRSRADGRPWRPIPVGSDSPFAPTGPSDSMAVFSIVEKASGDLAGEALLWGIDMHNRVAHLGISLRPSFRGRRLGSDVVGVLCHYGFAVRGLRRLQLETLADNTPMRSAAERAGFRHEGTLRGAAWVVGGFLDEVIYGQLVEEWPARG
jgi:RimJ/RimL family protein N-acetyltransferase